MNAHTKNILAAAVLVALSACGGGQQASGVPETGSERADDPVAATAVAIDAVGVANGSVGGDLVPTTAISAVTTDIGALAATTTTRVCAGGGSVTTDTNDVDPVGPSTGDSLKVTFSNCVEGGRTLNGTVNSTVVTLTGTPGSGAFTLNTTRATDLTIATAAGATIKSKATSSVNEASDGVKTTRNVKGNSAVDVTGTATSSSTQDYDIASTTDAATNTFTQTASLKSTSTTGGGHEVATPTPISGTIGSAPSAGIITIKHTAADGSISLIKATIQTDGTVLVETDSNGDGVIDTTTTRSWFGLIGLGVGPAFGFGPGGGQAIIGGPANNRPGPGTAGPGVGGGGSFVPGGGAGVIRGRLPVI